MTDLERITTENNLGIHGDAQDTLELAGRGIALVGTLLHAIEEEKATVERLQALIPHRVQQRRVKGWRMPPNTVSVARPHRWGNPFPVEYPITREDAVRMYRELVLNREAFIVTDPGTRWEVRNRFRDPVGDRPAPTLDEIRAELAGKNLACFCPLDQPCHADVLLKLANPKEHL